MTYYAVSDYLMGSAFLSPKACVVLIALFAIAVVLGITLAMMEERGKPLLDFFTCLSEAMMKITTWVIYLAPIGVFFLISGQGRRKNYRSRAIIHD